MEKTIIKKIEKKKGLYVVYGDSFEVSLSSSFFVEEILYVGKILSHNDCIRLRHLSEMSLPYDYAHRLLKRSPYSSHLLREKISIKYPECDDLNEIIFRLKKEGLLDDSSFAKAYKEEKEAALYGPLRIINDLRFKKGISQEILKDLSFEKEDVLLDALFPIIDARYLNLPYKRKVLKLEKIMLDRGFSKENAREYARKASVDQKAQKERLEADYLKAKKNYARKYGGYELRQRIIRSLLNKGYTMNDIEEEL